MNNFSYRFKILGCNTASIFFVSIFTTHKQTFERGYGMLFGLLLTCYAALF